MLMGCNFSVRVITCLSPLCVNMFGSADVIIIINCNLVPREKCDCINCMCVCVWRQSHIGRARSRSVGRRDARKRRAESAFSTNRSHSVSKSQPPRDKSGVRDEVVSPASISSSY